MDFKKISLPVFDNSYDQRLKETFDAINSNFELLSTSPLTKGDPGIGIRVLEYNLNCVFFREFNLTTNSSKLYTKNDNLQVFEEIEKAYAYYVKFKPVTQREYCEECKSYLRQIESAILGQYQYNKGSSNSIQDIDCIWWSDFDTKGSRQVLNRYFYQFRPGSLFVVINEDGTKMDYLQYLFIDPRFRMLDPSHYEDITSERDYSCAVKWLNGHFVAYNPFPQLYYSDGSFRWKMNGVDTGISAQGVDINQTSLFVVLRKDTDSNFCYEDSGGDLKICPYTVYDSDKKVYDWDGIKEGKYDVLQVYGEDALIRKNSILKLSNYEISRVKSIDPSIDIETLNNNGELYNITQNTEVDIYKYKGKPCIVLSDSRLWKNKNNSFWISTLEINNNKLQVYCGNENLVDCNTSPATLRDAFMKTNPDFDPYTTNSNKAIYLPIDSKYGENKRAHLIYSGRSEWYPNTDEYVWNQGKDTMFSTNKKILHITSHNDIDSIENSTEQYPIKNDDNRVPGCEVHIHEPVKIKGNLVASGDITTNGKLTVYKSLEVRDGINITGGNLNITGGGKVIVNGQELKNQEIPEVNTQDIVNQVLQQIPSNDLSDDDFWKKFVKAAKQKGFDFNDNGNLTLTKGYVYQQ